VAISSGGFDDVFLFKKGNHFGSLAALHIFTVT
jgi:hypothetical protein